MDDLKIYTVINSRYRVFDLSGNLPFSIVFGLCRRSKEDTDPRTLVLTAANSILDVPYALTHKLLTLRVEHPKWKTDVEVDVGQLSQKQGQQESYLTLPSPVGRTGDWRKCLSIYRYDVDPGSELASLFEPGKKYSINHTIKRGGDLGFGEYSYVESAEPLKEHGEPSASVGKPRLVNSRSDGRPTFQVVPSLPWPPKIQTRMQRYRGETKRLDNDEKSGDAVLDITVLNTGTETITAQTQGEQRCLCPRGPMYAEEGYPGADLRPRLIASNISTPSGSISVIDLATNSTVREASKPTGISPLYASNQDLRPRLGLLVALKPGEPLVRRVDATNLLRGLTDGVYGLKMEPRGMWWCVGSCEDFAGEGDDRVPHELFQTLIPPLILECEDIVEVQVENGVVI